MSKDPFERMRKEFERAEEDLRREMARAHEEIEREMKRARDELETAQIEFERQMEEARRFTQVPLDAHLPRSPKPPRSKRRRPPRKPPGGEHAPVRPRPNPTPFTDGVEAPID